MALLSLSNGMNKTATRPRTKRQTATIWGNSLALVEGAEEEEEETKEEEGETY